MKCPLKLQQLISELSHMKHSQEVSKSDQHAAKIDCMLLGYVSCVKSQI